MAMNRTKAMTKLRSVGSKYHHIAEKMMKRMNVIAEFLRRSGLI